jgi:ribosomal protein S18 acetylase RimI-like enzyme
MQDTIYETWFKEENENKILAYALAESDLNHTLNRSSFGLIAEVDSQAVGFILAHVQKNEPILRQFQSDPYDILPTLLSASPEEQTDQKTYYLRENEANRDMVKSTETDYDAEITLFIVGSNARGLGIGKKLFHEVKTHFETQDVKNYYLFTDDSCNYQFYEKQEMHRAQARPFQKTDSLEESTFNFYLYQND